MTMTKRVTNSFIGRWKTRDGSIVTVLTYDDKAEVFRGYKEDTNETLMWDNNANHVSTSFISQGGLDLIEKFHGVKDI